MASIALSRFCVAFFILGQNCITCLQENGQNRLLNDVGNSELSSWLQTEETVKLLSRNNPTKDRADALRTAEQGNLFEGDIILWPEQVEELLSEPQRRVKRKFVRSRLRWWDPAKPILYGFGGEHDESEKSKIRRGIRYWEANTCLRFREAEVSGNGNMIVFADIDGCASNVGRNPLRAPQVVSLGKECLTHGVIVHEIAHALGYWHEQSRPDRDDFITVQWSNIRSGLSGQFVKEWWNDVQDLGTPYDYGSIMHYKSDAYAQLPLKPTLRTNTAGFQRTIGQRDQLSFYDVKLMNERYCQGACRRQLRCLRGGFADSHDCNRCVCPDGFAGRRCEQVAASLGNHQCGGEMTVGEHRFVTIESPNYPISVSIQHCTWLVKAPPDMAIEARFDGSFYMRCNFEDNICEDYVEINNSTDFANTGMRFCCADKPEERIYSASNEILVLFRSNEGKGRFRLRLRAGKLLNRGPLLYLLVPRGDAWSSWGTWSKCSAPCGGCGTKQRFRTCQDASKCPGKAFEVSSCNTKPCNECAHFGRLILPCGSEEECIGPRLRLVVPCDDNSSCCEGYREVNGVCVPDGSSRRPRDRP